MAKVIRWLFGLALIAKGLELLTGAAAAGGYGAVLGNGLFAFAAIILGAVVISPELARWAALPFHRFIDGIYLPRGGRVEKPEPNYRLADHYYQTSQHDLAIEEYEKIIRNHPDEKRAYIALFDLWGNRKGEPAHAAKLYRRGLRKVRERDDRRELREACGSDDIASYVLGDEAQRPRETLGGRVKFPRI